MRRLLSAAVALCTTLGTASTLHAQGVTINFSEYACSEPSQPCEYQATTGRPVSSHGFDFLDRSSIFGGGGTNSLGTWSNNPSNLGYRNRPSNIGSATTLFAPGNGDLIEMYTSSGRNFDLYSMDVASLFRNSSINPPLGAVRGFNMYFSYFRSYDSFSVGRPDGDFYVSVAPGPLANGDRIPLLRTVDFYGPGTNGVSVNWLDGSPSDLRGTGIFGIEWAQASLQFDSTGAPSFATGSGRDHQFTNVAAEVVPEPGTFALAVGGMAVLVGVARRRRRDA